jgi:hypothetical protein
MGRGLCVAWALLLIACGAGTGSSDGSSVDVGGEILADGLDASGSDPGRDPGPGDAEAVEPPGMLRFVHVSDLHYAGTAEAPDPAWLSARVARVAAAVAASGADLVVSTGDHVDALPQACDAPGAPTPFDDVAAALDALPVPWLATIGNHEFYTSFEPVLEMTSDPAARRATFVAGLGHEPFSVHVVHGIRLVFLDTMDGPTWSENAGVIGSLTPERLAWLDDVLSSEARPTLVFAHHPLTTLQDPDDGPGLCDVLEAHADTVLATFGGHLHTFLKGHACGRPYWLVGNWRDADDAFFVVEVDGAAGTVTVTNEADLPFATPPDFTCTPGDAPLAADAAAAVGTVQRLVVTNTSTDATGLGQYVGDALQSIPFLLAVEGTSPTGLTGKVTVASRWAEPEGYFAYVDGSPCRPFDWRLDDPCVALGPATLPVNALLFLEALTDTAPSPDWTLRITVEDLRVEGRVGLDEAGVPVLTGGVVYARLETPGALADLRRILVTEYCAGRIEGCTPGSTAELPACPAEPDDAFFALVPATCDVTISGFTLRAILGMLKTLPETIHAVGEVTSEVVPPGAPQAGWVDPELFSTETGKNCAP